ncbi:hypothetical protein FACS189427_13160 [Planctomycetales bacterium]|nr:hypothetical protein FACS189427_13160 [Planctomycetales bacterium]
MSLNKTEAISILSLALIEGKLSIFVGSGISNDPPSSLPMWDGFVDKYIEICEELNSRIKQEWRFDSLITDAKTRKEGDPIRTISVLKAKVDSCHTKGNIDITVCSDKIKEMFYGAKPNKKHEAIVGTAYNYILTTNYDNLLEKAAETLSYKDLLNRSFSYTRVEQMSACVYSDISAIFHAHGRISELDFGQYVLTSNDYFDIMKRNPGLRYVLNTVFMSNSILFVGYGGSDPHFEDIITDVSRTLGWTTDNGELPHYYIVLKKDKVTTILTEHKKPVRTEIVEVDNYDEVLDILDALQKAKPRIKEHI